MSRVKLTEKTERTVSINYANGQPAVEVIHHADDTIELKVYDLNGNTTRGIKDISKDVWMDLSTTLWPDEVAYQFKDADES